MPLFGGGPDPAFANYVSSVTASVNANRQKAGIIENRLREFFSTLEDFNREYIATVKKLQNEIDSMNTQFEEIKNKAKQIFNEIKRIKSALPLYGSKDDILELEAIMNLADPANIINSSDVERITRKILEEKDLINEDK